MAPFKKILVAFSSAERDKPAVGLALRLAEKSGGRVTIAHVLPQFPEDLPSEAGGVEELTEILTHGAKDRLEEVLDSLPDTKVPITTELLGGPPDLGLVREVLRNRHHLLIKKGGPRTQVSSRSLGSVDMRLLRKCPCPVWIVKGEGHMPLTGVVAAVDPPYSDEVEKALNHSIIQLGRSVAEMDDAHLHVLHAWETWGENRLRSGMRADAFGSYVLALKSRASKAMSELLKPYKKDVPRKHRHILQGEPEEVIPDFVGDHGVNLVVMGTVARTGVPGHLIGNTAERILGTAPCSILALKPEGFSTPVELES